MTFRWYGPGDPIPLSYIKQIPNMSGVVTAVYDTPVGQVWSRDSIESLRSACAEAGLEMEVIESVPVHEDIKSGTGRRDEYIEAGGWRMPGSSVSATTSCRFSTGFAPT